MAAVQIGFGLMLLINKTTLNKSFIFLYFFNKTSYHLVELYAISISF